MKALATGRRVSKRPFCALSAALLVLVPGLARAAEPPCITPHEFNALSTYALPNALSATAQRCSASLPPDAFLKTGGPAMIARYAAGKPEAWPGARNVFLKLSSGQQGPVGDMLRAMPIPSFSRWPMPSFRGWSSRKFPPSVAAASTTCCACSPRCPRKARQTSSALPSVWVRRPDRQDRKDPDLQQTMTDTLLPADIVALAQQVIDENRAAGRKVALAESCTGGLVCAALTEIAGSSAVVDSGFITYSNSAKHRQLGVPHDIIDTFGAVSVACAWAMAQGALKHSDADVAVAISGIAGPDGGSPQKPVGLVVFAKAERGGTDVVAEERHFTPTSRASVRADAARVALELLLPPRTEDPAEPGGDYAI
jgi:nicotinamide-nucleotide amidase